MTRHLGAMACVAACVLALQGIATAQEFRVLVDFSCETNGCAPNSTLLKSSDGWLYGTTSEGAPEGDTGFIFKMSRTGQLVLLGFPSRPFFEASDRNFYGYANGEPDAGPFGSIFRMDHHGTRTRIYDFDGVTAAFPSTLIKGIDGLFYGMAEGGAYGNGVLFRANTAGRFQIVASFRKPTGIYLRGLLQAGNGSFYGTSYSGGTGGSGFVFRINTNGDVHVLYSFPASPGGGSSSEYGDLMQSRDGYFYGTELEAGAYEAGRVFRMTADGKVVVLHTFNRLDGAFPYAAPVEAPNGRLYGTTCSGGDYDMGTVWQLEKSGVLTVLHSFNGQDGACPAAGLALGGDHALYGTAAFGGRNNQGVAFRQPIP